MKWLKPSLIAPVLILILLLFYSHQVRAVRYDYVPKPFLDEWTHVWTGLSVRDTGVPAAWSDLRTYWDLWPSYEKAAIKQGIDLERFNVVTKSDKPGILRAADFPELILYTTQLDFGDGPRHTPIMQPFLDYPPLGGIILSSMIPSTVQTHQDVNPVDIRKASLWLADLTMILIFIFAWQLFRNPWVGLISAAVYGSAPTFLLTSRFALLENVLIPINLISLNLLFAAINYFKSNATRYKWFLIAAGVVAGCAFLIKPTGVAVILAGVLTLLILKEKVRIIGYYLIPALAVSSLYLIYGFLLAPSYFSQLLIEASSKRLFSGSLNFVTGFFKFGLKEFPIDGWWVGGFVSLLLLNYEKRLLPFLVSIVCMLFVILFMAGSFFPWYLIPMIPFVAIATGYLLWGVATSPKVANILVAFLFLFLSTIFWGYGVHGAAPDFINHQQHYLIYKILIVLGFAAAVVGPWLYGKNRTFTKVWVILSLLVIAAMVYLNFKSIYYIIGTWGFLSEHYPHTWKL